MSAPACAWHPSHAPRQGLSRAGETVGLGGCVAAVGGARQGGSRPGWVAVALNLLSAPRSLPLWRPWLPQAEEGTGQWREQTDTVSFTVPAGSVNWVSPSFLLAGLGSLFGRKTVSRSILLHPRHCCTAALCPGASPLCPASHAALQGWGQADPPGQLRPAQPCRGLKGTPVPRPGGHSSGG